MKSKRLVNRLPLRASLAVIGLLSLAGCQSNPSAKAETKVAEKPGAATAMPPTVAEGTALPYTGYHRYQGTVGGRPVTVVLTIDSTEAYPGKKLTCTGAYYYGTARHGLLDLQAPGTYRPSQPLRLEESAPGTPSVSGTWQATRPAGPVLSGTWSSPSGRQLPFELRETYRDAQGRQLAVRYEVLSENVVLPCQLERDEEETEQEYRTRLENAPNGYYLQFLHLLGPDTLRPALRALQCPVPRRRRQLMRAEAKKNGCNSHNESVQVDYNDYGLLACRYHWEDDMGGSRPAHSTGASVYVLHTGQLLALPEVLRPGPDSLLRRLITRHLLDGSTPDITPTPGLAMPTRSAELVPLPGGADLRLADFSLTNEGMAFGYSFDEMSGFVSEGSLLFAVVVPYRELLPLLRPDSPVARMLRERGIWREDRKK